MPNDKSPGDEESLKAQFLEAFKKALAEQVANETNQQAIVTAAKARIGDIVTNAIQDVVQQQKSTPISEMAFSSGDMLSHARSLFEYHAGQRWNSIRYFIVAYSLLANAYFLLQKNGLETSIDFWEAIILCIVSLIVTLCFWGLDRRNAELVEIDEFALKELENRAAVAHSSNNNSAGNFANKIVASFRITENAGRGIFFLHKVIQYKIILRILFFSLSIISMGALFVSGDQYCAFRHPGAYETNCSGLLPLSKTETKTGSSSATQAAPEAPKLGKPSASPGH